jgi:hypothetical protein
MNISHRTGRLSRRRAAWGPSSRGVGNPIQRPTATKPLENMCFPTLVEAARSTAQKPLDRVRKALSD